MRITLSGAMRARDVSRPTDEQMAAAEEREAKVARIGRPGGAGRVRGPAGGTSSVAAPGGAASAGAISDNPAPAGAAPGGAMAGRSLAGSLTPDRSIPDRPTKAATDKPDGPTAATPGWDNGRSDRRASVTPAPAADDAPSPRRRRRRRRGR